GRAATAQVTRPAVTSTAARPLRKRRRPVERRETVLNLFGREEVLVQSRYFAWACRQNQLPIGGHAESAGDRAMARSRLRGRWSPSEEAEGVSVHGTKCRLGRSVRGARTIRCSPALRVGRSYR